MKGIEDKGNSSLSPETQGVDDEDGRDETSLTQVDSKRGDRRDRLSSHSLTVNMPVDVLDSVGVWSEAVVHKIDRHLERVYISYLFWNDTFDEWVNDSDYRIAPIHTYTYVEGGEFRVGQRIEAKDPYNKWLEARVIEVQDSQVKVHYFRYSPKFDEYIDKKSGRLRRYGIDKAIVKSRRKEGKLWKVPCVESIPGMPGSPRGELHTSSSGVKSGGVGSERVGGGSDFSPASKCDYRADSKSTSTCKSCSPTSSTSTSKHDANANASAHMHDHRRHIAEYSSEYYHYMTALAANNLSLVPVSGDGNCLFRSVAHQVYGDEELHTLVRAKCMDYMETDASFFSQFIEGGLDSFPFYLRAKRTLGIWGDDPEIQAICELYNRPAEIWAYDSQTGARKLRTFHETALGIVSYGNRNDGNIMQGGGVGGGGGGGGVIRLSYYGGGHYDSIVLGADHSKNILPTLPGVLEDENIKSLRRRRRDGDHSALVEAQRLSDMEATERSTLEQALWESRQRGILSWADEDIEACLLLSIQQMAESKGSDEVKGISNAGSVKDAGIYKEVYNASLAVSHFRCCYYFVIVLYVCDIFHFKHIYLPPSLPPSHLHEPTSLCIYVCIYVNIYRTPI